MNEAVETLQKYFSEGSNTVHFHGDNTRVLRFIEMLSDDVSHEYEAPDLYAKYENEIWIIEHFEFDCFKSNRKGSSYKIELSRIDREEKNIIPTTEGAVLDSVIDAESSYDDYIKNVSKIFSSHYQRIENYKQNLFKDGIADENTKFIVLFLIDDVSPLGLSYVDSQGQWGPVVLAHSKEFLDLLKQSSSVDGILAVSHGLKEKLIWFIDRNQIEDYCRNAEDYRNCQFMNFKPHEVDFKLEITND